VVQGLRTSERRPTGAGGPRPSVKEKGAPPHGGAPSPLGLLSSRAGGLAARLRGAALQPRAAARLPRRDDRAAVPPCIVALARAPGGARRLEVEVQALVDQRLALAVAGQPRHAVARARVDHAAVVEAVDQPDAGSRRAGITRRAGRIAGLEDVLDRQARAVGVAVAHDAVEGGGGELPDELKILITPWRRTDGLHGGVRIVESCVGDDLAADFDAATRSVDDGLGDVLAAGLLSAGMRAPETRRAADNLLTNMRCGADASLASRLTAGRRGDRIAVGIDRAGSAVGLTCVLRDALARLAAG